MGACDMKNCDEIHALVTIRPSRSHMLNPWRRLPIIPAPRHHRIATLLLNPVIQCFENILWKIHRYYQHYRKPQTWQRALLKYIVPGNPGNAA